MTTATTTPQTTAPIWVSFPAHALPDVDWTDHGAAHRAVMRLFSPHLPGSPRARRAAGSILYRIDLQPDNTPVVLVQSQHPVQLLPPAARALTVPQARWDLRDGQQVMLRVAVNPLTRRTVKHDNGSRHEAVQILLPDQVPPWLEGKLTPGVQIRTVLNQVRTTTRTRRGPAAGSTPPQIVVETIDAIGVVTDATQFARMRREGVGRAKAYGCGLLTAVAAS
ncbi:type I-E CRISPR-associated protein Cas6/Cse3/CasE [Leekyejoonella antrihumi]|uniref:Type I-E CRISPR-associated protein Cas6/Cse3/CasE n=1 Tax=Leekyejoonella antrihumi TaxID=1660198 RepID=A0A563DRI4_9MICO|nr:type I-E CRISPR-associated protein Cas6/Cse3/CasE [Leekyejoonella antrihumi]TWP32835.1 type I-E CRISPR-associated protein Cas6/Cse3/CasE [Leekyejoonella antrihumi]